MTEMDTLGSNRQLMQVWHAQIGLVREQLNAAIVALSHEFAGIVVHLDGLIGEMQRLESDEVGLAGIPGADEAARHLQASAAHIDTETAGIRDRIAQSLLHLQFQDRVDQMLGHVQNGVSMLDTAFCQDERRVDFAAILVAMKTSSTTQEEEALHQGHDVAGKPGDADELTFF